MRLRVGSLSIPEENVWEKSLIFASKVPFVKFAYVLVIGIGWDDEHPLRPWPWLSWGPTDNGHPTITISCFGLFLTQGLGKI